jgi:hypothetical protein
MDSDTILTLGLLGIGGYAAYRLLNNLGGGIQATGDAVGSVATQAGGVVTDLLGETRSAEQSLLNGQAFQQVTGSFINATKGLFSDRESAFDTISKFDPFTAPMNLLMQEFNEVSKLFKSNVQPFTPRPDVDYTPVPPRPYVDYTPVPLNFTSASGGSIYVSPPTMLKNSPPAAASTVSTQRAYTPAVKSPSPVSGAPVGTIFRSGASVKSTGASGKYKTTL